MDEMFGDYELDNDMFSEFEDIINKYVKNENIGLTDEEQSELLEGILDMIQDTLDKDFEEIAESKEQMDEQN